jgi:hypothetical protein
MILRIRWQTLFGGKEHTVLDFQEDFITQTQPAALVAHYVVLAIGGSHENHIEQHA